MNPLSGCWVPASARLQECLLRLWAHPYGPDGQMTITLHIYRSRQFQRTLFGVNQPSGCWVTDSARSGQMDGWTDGQKDGRRLFYSPPYFPSERQGTIKWSYDHLILIKEFSTLEKMVLRLKEGPGINGLYHCNYRTSWPWLRLAQLWNSTNGIWTSGCYPLVWT